MPSSSLHHKAEHDMRVGLINVGQHKVLINHIY